MKLAIRTAAGVALCLLMSAAAFAEGNIDFSYDGPLDAPLLLIVSFLKPAKKEKVQIGKNRVGGNLCPLSHHPTCRSA